MAVTYYVALPFIRTEDGTAPGEAQECQSEGTAIRRAEGMSRDPANAGAVAFKRADELHSCCHYAGLWLTIVSRKTAPNAITGDYSMRACAGTPRSVTGAQRCISRGGTARRT